ncbi:PLC-like phosphodiesterase [Mycena chlorophos]|uniref:PLC-like phosphodiesterase n=1 Tax=Mycena chlorophos TaxID=658473 RepID=A0A8H6WSM5_MYCCL|nr:PLC-like phosphodiesterase [Mycena chlorophos]
MHIEQTPALGYPIPPSTPHGVANALPEWEHNLLLPAGKAAEIMKESTYPRFTIHPHVVELTEVIATSLRVDLEEHLCILFPALLLAEEFQSYVHLNCAPAFCTVHDATQISNPPQGHSIFAAVCNAPKGDVMSFHIFSGSGISPRLAEICLQRRAGRFDAPLSLPSLTNHCFSDYYLRHAPLESAAEAKQLIRTRVSGLIGGTNIRGVPGTSPEDVYLYASGMQAIWRCHKLLAALNPTGAKLKVAHVKFVNLFRLFNAAKRQHSLLYCDSYRFLELPDGSGFEFFTADTVDDLEKLLESGTPTQPAVLAICTDFPGNPHIRSADLRRLHTLAQKHGVPLIVDETICSFLNVQVLPYCDLAVSSLTKLFSGMANVLGGAIMLNPTSRFYPRFKSAMQEMYADYLFDHDALVLEMNSREIVQRTAVTNENAEKLADMLYSLSQAGGVRESVLVAVHYPKYRDRENFECVQNPLAVTAGLTRPGYGCLLSATFASLEATKAFYNALQCYKGTTLGTVFTLATAFSVLAFPPAKMEWIEEHGVEKSLVRFSVGMEDPQALMDCVRDALNVAQNAVGA